MMDNVEQKIIDYVDSNREAMIGMLQDLVRIPSITGYEKDAQEYVADRFRKLGFDVKFSEPDVKKMFEMFPDVAQVPSIGEEGLDMPLMTEDRFTYEQLMASPYDRLKTYKDRPNVVAFIKGKGQGKSLIINGHIDTVPVGDESKWSQDPFGGKIIDGSMYGRGSVDMKGGIAAMIGAAETLVKLGIPLSGDLMCQSVVNEEHAGAGALGVVAEGYKADAAIVTEPSGSGANIILDGNGGGVYWEVRVKGHETHAGSRWQNMKMFGVSAIEKAALVVNSLISLEEGLNKEQTLMSLCVGKMHGGTYSTATAAECVINGVAYFSPYLGTGKEGINNVKNMLKEAVMGINDPWLKQNPPVLKFQHYDDAYLLPDDKREISDTVAGAITDTLGKDVAYSRLAGGCDARHLGNQGGIPTIIYGPGNLAMAHRTDECIDIEDYIKSIKVLAVSAYRWCR